MTVTKFLDHGPVHRQHRMFARSGVTVPVSTLADWIARSAIWWRPSSRCWPTGCAPRTSCGPMDRSQGARTGTPTIQRGARCGATWGTIATRALRVRRDRQGRGRAVALPSRGGKGMCRPMPPTCSTASTTGASPKRSRSAAWRTRGGGSSTSRTRTAGWRIRCS
ncbi:MAG: transposase [Deltaproteobacteria bacterium]|nr:transposase [Deltaproteobacteria bacterium]